MCLLHQDYDLLLTPQLAVTAFEAGHEVPPGTDRTRWWEWSPFTYPFNLSQQPAATVPCGFTRSGLPVALQLVGDKFCRCDRAACRPCVREGASVRHAEGGWGEDCGEADGGAAAEVEEKREKRKEKREKEKIKALPHGVDAFPFLFSLVPFLFPLSAAYRYALAPSINRCLTHAMCWRKT